MNMTHLLFPSTAGAPGDTPVGVSGTLAGGSESLSGQGLGVANPFALLLSGQLQSATDPARLQGLPVALPSGKLAPGSVPLLPQTGNPLPEDVPVADPTVDAASPSAALLPLQLAAVVQQFSANEGTGTQLQGNGTGDGNLTLNIMKLALGDVDKPKNADSPLPVLKSSVDDQSMLRFLQSGALRADADRAGSLLQPNPVPVQPASSAQDPGNTAASAISGEIGRPLADAQARPATVAQATLPQPLGKQGWDQDLGSRLVWMSKQHLDGAQLRLNPAHLGPLEVRLSVQHDQTANVTFLSNHAPVREAVEAALPRLREMLAESGVNLTDVNVSSQSQGQAREHGPSTDDWFAQAEGELDSAGAEGAVRNVSMGLVDYFA